MDDPKTLYPRFLEPRVRDSLADTPVTLIAGPRQAGKTTLVKHFDDETFRYLTLDDETTLLAAQQDPVGFVRDLDRAIIDEVQRVPSLLLAIKKSVDENRRPGRFLLTGSANIMTLPKVADSLAGRMEVLPLLPLSQGELHHCRTDWVNLIFSGQPPRPKAAEVGPDLVKAVVQGGYPEVVARPAGRRRSAWIRQYIDALIQRDVREIATVEKLESLPRFLRALSAVSGQLCNYSQLGGHVGLDHKTVAKYMAVFEQMFLLRRVEPWASNLLKRIVKTPKLHFLDSGILSWLSGVSLDSIQKDRRPFGNMLESFVYAEMCKAISFAGEQVRISHYRDKDQVEVDFVLENERGEIVAVEVKAGATVVSGDLAGLNRLIALTKGRLKLGLVLYDGKETIPLGDKIYAAPISSLWCK